MTDRNKGWAQPIEIANIDLVFGLASEAGAVAAAAAAAAELARARRLHAPMHSAHKGYAVLLEELDELWDEVKKREPDVSKLRAEAIQVAAMALRFVVDVCDREEPST